LLSQTFSISSTTVATHDIYLKQITCVTNWESNLGECELVGHAGGVLKHAAAAARGVTGEGIQAAPTVRHAAAHGKNATGPSPGGKDTLHAGHGVRVPGVGQPQQLLCRTD
jgi:hypothetical protein